jgi:CHAT domain-containing protein/tetratricopeptide (TPR) repeat protein
LEAKFLNANQKAEELYRAINQERFADARHLLEDGAGVNYTDSGDFPNTGLTALHWAAFYGQLDLVRELLDRGADLDASDVMGRTPLVCAAMTGHSPVVELLLERGSNLRAMHYPGWTLIPQAERSKDVVAVLHQYGYDESTSRDDRPVSKTLSVYKIASSLEYPDFIAGVRHQEVYDLLIHGILVLLQGLADDLHAEFIENIATVHKSLSQFGAERKSLSDIEVATAKLLTSSDFKKLVNSQTAPERVLELSSYGTQTFDRGIARIRETLPIDNSLRYTMGTHTASACFHAAMILSLPQIFSTEPVLALHSTHSKALAENARFTRSNLQLYLGTEFPDYEQMPSYIQCVLAIATLVERDPGIRQETALKIVNLSRDLFDVLRCKSLSIRIIEEMRLLHDPRVVLFVKSALQHASKANSKALRMLERYSITSDPNYLEMAVAEAQKEAEQQTYDNLAHAIHLNKLGGALGERFLNHGDIADLDRSIQIAYEILPHFLDTPGESSLRNNLGLALERKFSFNKERATIDRSINELTKAVYPMFPLSEVSVLWRNNLGNALRARYANFHDVKDLKLAIPHLTRALKLTPNDSKDLALHRFSLAHSLIDRYFVNADSKDLNDAIELYEMAVNGTQEESPDFPKFAGGLANTIQLRYELWRASADLEYARRIYKRAVRSGMDSARGYALKYARAWGDWAYQRQAWFEAAEAYSYAFAASDSLHITQLKREDKEAWLQDTQGLAANSAYVQIKTGRLSEAATQLEHGIARLVSEQLDIGRTDLATDPLGLSQSESPASSLKLLAIETIREIASDTPVVYITSTAQGGFALFVGREDEETVIWLPGLTSGRVDGLLRLYQSTYESRDIRENDWFDALDTITQELWSLAMGPILEAIEGLHAVVLIPVGSLSLFPFHAAWRLEPSKVSGRLYACDLLSISYAPNVLALARPRAMRSVTDVSIISVMEPKLSRLPPLPYAQTEVTIASQMFPKSRVIVGHEATRQTVLTSLDFHDVAHIACHATADLINPLRGRIYLANDEALMVEEILSERFHLLRLAVLSACETGIPGTKLPDEVVGFPTSLIQAGVPSVIASLWSVSDCPTCLLMMRFYYLWRSKNIEPILAFGDAQRWLRDSTNGEKMAFLITLKVQLGHIQEIDLLMGELTEEDENQRHYLHLFNWAGFTWTGSRLF